MKFSQLFRQAGPRLLWTGQLTSSTGDRLYAVALVWLTLRLTGSPAAVGLVSLASTVPFLATSLIAGSVADGRDGLRLARAASLLQAVLVAVVPVLYLTGRLSVLALALVACGLSALEAFCLPSLQASLPRLVANEDLTPMVSLLDSTDRLARVLGPGAIGLLVLIVPEIHLFTLDAATFLVSGYCLSRVIRLARPPAILAAPASGSAGPQSWRSQLAAGWRVVWTHATLRRAVALRGACNLAWPAFTIGIPFLVADHFHRGVGAYGLILGAFGLGNLAGNAFASRIGESGLLRWCGIAWALAGVGFVALALAPTYYLLVLATIGLGVCTPLANVTVDAFIARTVEHTMLARTYATQRFIVVAAGAAGLPAAAATISTLGVPACLAAAGGFMSCAALWTLGVNRHRHRGRAARKARPYSYRA